LRLLERRLGYLRDTVAGGTARILQYIQVNITAAALFSRLISVAPGSARPGDFKY